jgi:hypothetical protein
LKGEIETKYDFFVMAGILIIGGLALGLFFGFASSFWMKKIFNDEILVVNITMISCYLVIFKKKQIYYNFFYFSKSRVTFLLNISYLALGYLLLSH